MEIWTPGPLLYDIVAAAAAALCISVTIIARARAVRDRSRTRTPIRRINIARAAAPNSTAAVAYSS